MVKKNIENTRKINGWFRVVTPVDWNILETSKWYGTQEGFHLWYQRYQWNMGLKRGFDSGVPSGKLT